jgi:hypothetical protein
VRTRFSLPSLSQRLLTQGTRRKLFRHLTQNLRFWGEPFFQRLTLLKATPLLRHGKILLDNFIQGSRNDSRIIF